MTIIATLYIYNSPQDLQGMTNNVGLGLVTLLWFTITIEQDN